MIKELNKMSLINDNRYSNYLNTSGLKNGVFYLGHASILVSISGKKILIDPILLSAPYSDAWTFFPSQISDRRFFDVDCIIVSHFHQDHYDIEFLKKIDGSIPIVIIGGRPSFELDLMENNIKYIKFVPPEIVTEILDNVYLYGINHETNGIDSSAIIYNDEFCVYHGNDNFLTEYLNILNILYSPSTIIYKNIFILKFISKNYDLISINKGKFDILFNI
jgi:hypothetical protein